MALTLLWCCVSASAQDAALDDAAIEVGTPVVETNPAVRAALELPRETPADHFQAIVWLIDLGRPELAKPILEELTKLQLTDAQRAELVAQFGSRDMLRLARAKELAPAGAAFADACTAAAAATANDPQRIATLIAQLTDASPEIRQMARADLAATGQTGVTAALEALAGENDPQRRNSLVEAIVQMSPEARGPLLGTLVQQRNRNEFGWNVIRILQALQVSQAAPLIAAYTRSPDAERLLVDALGRYRRGTPAFVADESHEVALWLWCKGHLEVNRHPADEAQTIWMARLALELAKLRPDIREYQKQALVLAFDAGLWVRNLDGTFGVCDLAGIDVQGIVDTADVALLNGVLTDALKQHRGRAALRAVELLGERGDANLLDSRMPEPSPLAAALINPNRRVRFAALRTIMNLDPASPYPGSSRVPDALAWFAGSNGERRALVAMPTLAASTNLAGMLAAHGLDAEATNRGRDAVNMARDMADLEMIFVDMDIQAPGIRQVIYELRTSATTGEVPIALMAAEGRLEAAEQLATEHQRMIAVSRPHSNDVLARVVKQLVKMAGRDPVPPDERAAQAAEAAAWLNQLAATRPFYTIRRTAHFEP